MEADVLPRIHTSSAKGESIGKPVQEARNVSAILGNARLHVLVPLDERPGKRGEDREDVREGEGGEWWGFERANWANRARATGGGDASASSAG